jgi:hypothetical protein
MAFAGILRFRHEGPRRRGSCDEMVNRIGFRDINFRWRCAGWKRKVHGASKNIKQKQQPYEFILNCIKFEIANINS